MAQTKQDPRQSSLFGDSGKPGNKSSVEAISPALQRWKDKRDALDEIPVRDILERLGAMDNQDGDRDKYKLPGVGNIIVRRDEQVWYNGNLQQGGNGAVRLVMHGLGFEKQNEALDWIVENFPEYAKDDWAKMAAKGRERQSSQNKENRERSFAPPERDDSVEEDVRTYLVRQRGLPEALIDREISEGRLYASRRYDKKSRRFYGEARATFAGPGTVEIRSVDPDGFKGSGIGNDTKNSGYQVPFLSVAHHEKVVGMVEAAVDALSYHALHPNRWCLSCNGAGRFELQYRIALECSRNGFTSDLALDADMAGDLAVQRVVNGLYLRDRLAKEWDTTPEEIDVLLLTKKVEAIPGQSPHEMFLTHRDDGNELEVREKQFDTNEEGERTVKWTPTGETAKSTICVKVARKIKKKALEVERGEYTFALTQDDVSALLEKYHVRRSRPVGVKDWNDAWKLKGPDGVAEYNAMAARSVAPEAERGVEGAVSVGGGTGGASAPMANANPSSVEGAATEDVGAVETTRNTGGQVNKERQAGVSEEHPTEDNSLKSRFARRP